jgi:ribosome recycling factor
MGGQHMGMTDDVSKDLKARIDKTIDDLRRELSKIRTGRANLAMLDGVKVDYYGTPTPLAQCAALAVPEPRLITIKPWDKSVMKDIEKAIKEANLGLNPMNDGEMIRLPIPPLTEERRKDIAKQVKTKGEDHKVAIRNERRDANEKLKVLLKDKKITEDENKRGMDQVQKHTDAGVKSVEEVAAKKEKEVMEV